MSRDVPCCSVGECDGVCGGDVRGGGQAVRRAAVAGRGAPVRGAGGVRRHHLPPAGAARPASVLPAQSAPTAGSGGAGQGRDRTSATG